MRWLPVEERTNPNILLIIYKIFNEQSAGFLELLIEECHPPRALRWSSRLLLCTPAITDPKHMEDASFPLQHLRYGTPPQNMPKKTDNVATFNTKLKTFLFTKYFHWFLWLTFIYLFFVLYKFLLRVSVVLIRVVFETSFTVVISYPLMMMI